MAWKTGAWRVAMTPAFPRTMILGIFICTSRNVCNNMRPLPCASSSLWFPPVVLNGWRGKPAHNMSWS
eukprot:1425556-Lingulodinium_polyedra.AAC.1